PMMSPFRFLRRYWPVRKPVRRPGRATPRPTVEPLEDRCVPAGFATPNQNFVAALFPALLGRPAGQNDFVVIGTFGNLLDRGMINRIQVVAALENTVEHRIHEAVEDFQDVLRRAPQTPADINLVFQLANLRAFGLTNDQVRAFLFNLDEAFARRGARNDEFARELFRDILDVDPSPEQVNALAQFLNNGGSRFAAALFLEAQPQAA